MKRFFLCTSFCVLLLSTWGLVFYKNLKASPYLPTLSNPPSLRIPLCGNPLVAKTILDQPFSYIGSGGQMYVFVSQDEKYVLKFFKNIPHPFLPFPSYQNRKRKKLERDIQGYTLAFQKLEKESALLFLHCQLESKLNLQTTLLFPGKKPKNLELDTTYFVLQKKAIPLISYIQQSKKPQKALDAAINLIRKRLQLGIYDQDPRYYHNIGFVEDVPIFLDPGRFVQEHNPPTSLPEKFTSWVKSQGLVL